MLALSLVASSAWAQDRVGTPLTVRWDFALAEIVAEQVVLFESRVDGLPWIDTGLPMLASVYDWTIPPALLPVGQHTVEVRACSEVTCGPSAVLPLEILPILPQEPLNPRLIVGAVRVDTSMAIQLGDSYALIARGRKLTTAEETALGLRKGGLTVGAVLHIMDASYAKLLTGSPLP